MVFPIPKPTLVVAGGRGERDRTAKLVRVWKSEVRSGEQERPEKPMKAKSVVRQNPLDGGRLEKSRPEMAWKPVLPPITVLTRLTHNTSLLCRP